MRTLNTDKRVDTAKNIIIINIYVPNLWALKYMRQRLVEWKGKIQTSTIIVEDFNTLRSIG